MASRPERNLRPLGDILDGDEDIGGIIAGCRRACGLHQFSLRAHDSGLADYPNRPDGAAVIHFQADRYDRTVNERSDTARHEGTLGRVLVARLDDRRIGLAGGGRAITTVQTIGAGVG